MTKAIAVGGIATSMPDEFPHFDENSGNMLHGMAPHEMFPNAADVRGSGWRKHYSAPDVMTFINEQCSHYVFSFANFIQVGNLSERKREAYASLTRSLERSRVPIVPFGLGAQAPLGTSAEESQLPEEAITFMKFLGERCEVISVRGQYTADLFREVAGVTNTMVTGCPSFFSRPGAFAKLRESLSSGKQGAISFNATHLRSLDERRLMLRAIRENHFWVEVHDASTHDFAIQCLTDPELAAPPAYLTHFLGGTRPNLSRQELVNYFASRYRLFRDVAPWYQYHAEYTRFSYGTRFHGNMAALLTGVPALWLTHDSRTLELCETLHLPRMSVSEAWRTPIRDLIQRADYSEMFEHLPELFGTFNEFLALSGLPTVDQGLGLS